MKLLLKTKKSFHLFGMLSVSLILLALFQNCGQKGDINLTTMLAAAQVVDPLVESLF
jgi:hypothetical protein